MSTSERIPLPGGRFVIVDKEDWDALRIYNWKIVTCNIDHRVRAIRYGGNSKGIYMHRQIMGAMRGQIIDHKNRNTLDNRRCNLRPCTKAQNAWNSLRVIAGKTSKFKGVCRRKKLVKGRPWLATITIGGKQKFLGYHATQRAAALAYDVAARELFGEFALLNLGAENG